MEICETICYHIVDKIECFIYVDVYILGSVLCK